MRLGVSSGPQMASAARGRKTTWEAKNERPAPLTLIERRLILRSGENACN